MRRARRLTSVASRKGVRKNEVVRYRDRKGRLRSFTSKVLLRAEVWKNGKPTNKILNTFHKKTKKVVYRRFSSKERALYHRQVLDDFEYKPSAFLSHRVRSSQLIESQIPKKWIDKIKQVIQMDDICLYSVKIYLEKGIVLETQTVTAEHTKNLEADIATMIIATLRANRIRTSAKKWSGKKPYWATKTKGIGEWRFYRSYEIELVIRGMGF